MVEKPKRMLFLAEADAPEGDRVRFRYVIDGSAEVVLPREWWEQLGCPDMVEVGVEPERDDGRSSRSTPGA